VYSSLRPANSLGPLEGAGYPQAEEMIEAYQSKCRNHHGLDFKHTYSKVFEGIDCVRKAIQKVNRSAR